MIRHPPNPTLFPYTTLFQSDPLSLIVSTANAFDCLMRHHKLSREDALKRFVNTRAEHHPAAHVKDRKSTRLNSSHANISYAVFCLKKNHSSKIQSRHYYISC